MPFLLAVLASVHCCFAPRCVVFSACCTLLHIHASTHDAEYLTGAIEAVSETSGINQAFLGLIVLPIAGNAAEHITVGDRAGQGRAGSLAGAWGLAISEQWSCIGSGGCWGLSYACVQSTHGGRPTIMHTCRRCLWR